MIVIVFLVEICKILKSFTVCLGHFSLYYFSCRCCEKHKKEAIRFQSVNEKLAATKKLLLAENNRLQKELLQLVNENEYIRQLLQNVREVTSSICIYVVVIIADAFTSAKHI